jgi:hypothetical protein
MSLLATRRSRLAASASAATLVVGATLAVTATPAFAADMTITTVSPAKVAAATANRVILINGTNFDEDSIASITVGGDADCAALTSYVVTSPTQISLKTPGNGTNTASVPGCAASSGGTAESITITPTSSGGATVTKASAVTFVTPPTIDVLANNPVISDNSSLLAAADQVKDFTTAGGQLLRIKSGGDFLFDGRTAAGLTGTYGGKALTTVGFQNSDGTTLAATAAPTGSYNYWLARTGTALTAATDPTLAITQNTVGKNFATAATGTTISASPTVTSLDVTSGKTGAATTFKITGTGFSTTAGDLTVKVCGRTADISGSPTLTSITAVTPNANSSTATDLTALKTAIGGTAGVCPVTVTKGGVTSPVTSGSFFAFVDR